MPRPWPRLSCAWRYSPCRWWARWARTRSAVGMIEIERLSQVVGQLRGGRAHRLRHHAHDHLVGHDLVVGGQCDGLANTSLVDPLRYRALAGNGQADLRTV